MVRNCILCGKYHEIGTPCDFKDADSILQGKINIQPQEAIIVYQEPEIVKESPKKGRPSGKHR